MKYILAAMFLISNAFAQQNVHPQITKTFRYDKVMILNHNYIIVSENFLGAQSYLKHDPDCHCKRFTEEMVAKVIAEVLRLKDNQKEITSSQ